MTKKAMRVTISLVEIKSALRYKYSLERFDATGALLRPVRPIYSARVTTLMHVLWQRFSLTAKQVF